MMTMTTIDSRQWVKGFGSDEHAYPQVYVLVKETAVAYHLQAQFGPEKILVSKKTMLVRGTREKVFRMTKEEIAVRQAELQAKWLSDTRERMARLEKIEARASMAIEMANGLGSPAYIATGVESYEIEWDSFGEIMTGALVVRWDEVAGEDKFAAHAVVIKSPGCSGAKIRRITGTPAWGKFDVLVSLVAAIVP